MTEKIQKRIDELTQEREAQKQRLTQQAQLQIAKEIAPYDSAIGELKRLLEPAPDEALDEMPDEETNGDTTTAAD